MQRQGLQLGGSVAQRNPAPQGLIPKELKFFAFENELAITATESALTRAWNVTLESTVPPAK